VPEWSIDCICAAGELNNGDVCYVDDNGALLSSNKLWKAAWYPCQMLAGCGLIIGTGACGDNAAAKSSVRHVRQLVRWTHYEIE
jgi:hypothetical protein